MTHPNAELIERFYQAFQRQDGEAMAACYAEHVQFSDPVFHDLKGRDAGDMWRMLCARAKQFSLTFEVLEADDRQGRARWVATYLFSQTGRMVENHIEASFRFEAGKIVEHHDRFDLWRWARQALGAKGLLLGWLAPVQAAIGKQAMAGLRAWQAGRRAG
ncbi:nuclear transport factor 2 family protein [Pseudomonas sp. BMS12]|uniref:nuclear transport factor 2 family protein n=1 Tax=Pseudomonas sp. BMS12 TaxID=1796033 RepID=UPI00083AD23E|nr:nuclear transport factor 2 family protein [Pseudomonas sp. BMS12]